MTDSRRFSVARKTPWVLVLGLGSLLVLSSCGGGGSETSIPDPELPTDPPVPPLPPPPVPPLPDPPQPPDPPPPSSPPPVPVDLSAAVFDETTVNDFRITMAPSDWEAILGNPALEVWRSCTFEWNGEVLDQVGVQASGNSSSWPGNPKMSLKFHFNEFVHAQQFRGLRHLKLDGMSLDRSMMRDRLAYGIFRSRIAAPRSCHGRLFVNGGYRGLYEVEERIDDVFVAHRFGPVVGDLYRVSEAGFDQYAWKGTDPALYVTYPWKPKSNENANSPTPYDPTRVVQFLDVLNHAPAFLDTVCDVDAVLEYFAVEAAISDERGIAADGSPGPNDHWQCRRGDSGKFVVIPWDLDRTFSSAQTQRPLYQNFSSARLSARVRDDPALSTAYREKIGEILAGPMSAAQIHARIDFVYDQIRELVYGDPRKTFANQKFDEAVAALHDFMDRRAAYLSAQIGP